MNVFFSQNTKYYKPGFTLLELLVASLLMSFAAIMIASFWRTISLSMNDLISRSKNAEEMRFVTENISRDFGPAVGITILDNERFIVCQDSGKTPNGIADWGEPDIVVEYFIQDNQLRRFNQTSGVETTIADGLSLFEIEEAVDSLLHINIELQDKDIIRRASFLWNKP